MVKNSLEEHTINSYQKYLSSIHPTDSNLWTTTKRLFNSNSNKIPPLKAGNVYLNTDFDKCELFAHTLKNVFTLNDSLENSTKQSTSTKTM